MPERKVQFFCDESGVDGDSRFIAIGMLYTTAKSRRVLRALIGEIRDEERFFNEIHFVKTSRLRDRVYRKLLGQTLPYVRYRIVIVDRHDLDLAAFGGKRYIALNYFTKKMVAGYVHPGIRGVLYLDFRTRERKDNGLEYLIREVNLAKPDSLKAVEPLDSKLDDLMQLSDLYLGLLRHGYEHGRPLKARGHAPSDNLPVGRKGRLYDEFVRLVRSGRWEQNFRMWEWKPRK